MWKVAIYGGAEKRNLICITIEMIPSFHEDK